MKTLTVRENLAFSANVRLSEAVPATEIRELVDSVLEELGLTDCADTQVNNYDFNESRCVDLTGACSQSIFSAIASKIYCDLSSV